MTSIGSSIFVIFQLHRCHCVVIFRNWNIDTANKYRARFHVFNQRVLACPCRVSHVTTNILSTKTHRATPRATRTDDRHIDPYMHAHTRKPPVSWGWGRRGAQIIHPPRQTAVRKIKNSCAKRHFEAQADEMALALICRFNLFPSPEKLGNDKDGDHLPIRSCACACKCVGPLRGSE